MTVSKPVDPFERRDQGSDWLGNFAPGDHLIWTRDVAGAMVIDFAVPVLGAGAQIQRDAYGTFTGTIQAYDTLGNLLGSFNLTGIVPSVTTTPPSFWVYWITVPASRRLCL
jgi:hypothetical protein